MSEVGPAICVHSRGRARRTPVTSFQVSLMNASISLVGDPRRGAGKDAARSCRKKQAGGYKPLACRALLEARIMGKADIYDALVRKRVQLWHQSSKQRMISMKGGAYVGVRQGRVLLRRMGSQHGRPSLRTHPLRVLPSPARCKQCHIPPNCPPFRAYRVPGHRRGACPSAGDVGRARRAGGEDAYSLLQGAEPNPKCC